jgi:methylenetetrahydrofolate dehydrogenase (NADP+) / methenyltetrahydrofolate cyclohydrolase
MARILDGKQLAATMQAEIAEAAAKFAQVHGRKPGLAAVLVGDNPASHVYVRNKRTACAKACIENWLHSMPAVASQAALLDLIGRLNRDPLVDGILVQLPLPGHIDEKTVLENVSPLKDVDGLGPVSLGLLTAGQPRFAPCTPLGVQQLLVRNQIGVEGKHVVIVGRSNLVGKPLALLLMQKGLGADATVTVCHSRTPDIASLTRQADIVVMAIGRATFLSGNMVKPGAVVVDVGINRLPSGKLVGDVDFEGVSSMASAITPVPGGVGPMTITMLLHNTVKAAQLSVGPARGVGA